MLISGVFYSCKKAEAKKTINEVSSIDDVLVNNQETTKLNEHTFKIGIKKILPIKITHNDYRIFIQRNDQNINGFQLNENYSEKLYFSINELNERVLYFDKSSISLNILNEKISIVKNGQSFDYKNLQIEKFTTFENTEILQLVILYTELTSSLLEREELVNFRIEKAEKGNVYLYGYGLTESKADYNSEVMKKIFLKQNPNCRAAGKPDSFCAFGELGCITFVWVVCN